MRVGMEVEGLGMGVRWFRASRVEIRGVGVQSTRKRHGKRFSSHGQGRGRIVQKLDLQTTRNGEEQVPGEEGGWKFRK